MHLYFYARGIIDQIEKFKIISQSHFWVWKRKNIKTGEMEETLVQGALRPSLFGMWEYIFPEECLAEVLTVFGFTEEDSYLNFFNYTKLKNLQNQMLWGLLRKALNAKKVPKEVWKAAAKIPKSIKINNSMRGLSNNETFCPAVVLHLVGIKEDRRQEA